MANSLHTRPTTRRDTCQPYSGPPVMLETERHAMSAGRTTGMRSKQRAQGGSSSVAAAVWLQQCGSSAVATGQGCKGVEV